MPLGRVLAGTIGIGCCEQTNCKMLVALFRMRPVAMKTEMHLGTLNM